MRRRHSYATGEKFSLCIDVTNQRSGGGLQVAMGVLDALASSKFASAATVLVERGSALHHRATELQMRVAPVNGSKTAQLWRQVGFPLPWSRESDHICYTVFGPPSQYRRSRLKVAGVAYSNLFYPEVEFWKSESRVKRLVRRAIDAYRLNRVLKADILVFETTAVQQRAIMQHDRLAISNTLVFPPAPAREFGPVERTERKVAEPARPLGLLAAGWHPNKNLSIIPQVADEFARRGVPFDFVLTLEEESPGGKSLARASERLRVRDRLQLVGRIEARRMPELVRSCSVVLLISELESFSNNIIEAFACQVPLVVSDRDWARSICGDAAQYCNPLDPKDIADALLAATETTRRNELVARGSERLIANFQSPVERLEDLVDSAIRLGRESL